ncbi:MAG: glycosyltransferase family 2 protein [Alphaproteobacteria bacterium]|nr:glycosyltransferase family 2 protein [Alphaproteobacteria bacterium]
MADPLIDVVIPTFNAAKTVRSAVESIQRQTLSAIRIIVVDDGSTDETPALLRDIAAADPRVEIVTLPNGGIVGALNAGLARCGAEFVARQDADDLAAPDRFEKQVAYLKAHTDCIAVSGATRHIDENGEFHGMISRCDPPEAADPWWIPAVEPYLVHPFLMARRGALAEVGGYRYVLHAEDSDLYWRMQEIGRLHNLHEIMGDYRMHSDSISSRSVTNGRIQAVLSQLCVISALRRRAGRPDLAFPEETVARYAAAATSLGDLFAVGCEGLVPEEVDHLEIAVAGKLLELSSYRPYEVELDDCRFIRSALGKHAGRLRPANRAALARSSSGTAARLFHRGRFREAAALVSPAQYPATVGRVALRAVASPAARSHLRRTIGRRTNVLLK